MAANSNVQKRSKLALGYGSEWHLLRILGRHRAKFTAELLRVTSGTSIDWIDFDISPDEWAHYDSELKALSFLHNEQTQKAYRTFWPQSGNPVNWDSVGILRRPNLNETILLEAKANIQEIKSSSGASGASMELIHKSIDRAMRDVSRKVDVEWTRNYYQFANRIAHLHFLQNQGHPARLVMLYFLGDTPDTSRTTPQTPDEWAEALAAQDEYLGIDYSKPLSKRIHKVFLDIRSIEIKSLPQ